MAKKINAGVLAIAAMAASSGASANVEAVVAVKAPTKADLAREVFHAAYAEPVVPRRKDILELAQVVANLSKAAASTYFQNFKRKEGLVRSAAPASA